jgi:uncharacterized membrane-anchored protein
MSLYLFALFDQPNVVNFSQHIGLSARVKAQSGNDAAPAVKLQKSGEEGGVIAKMGGVKLQKSAGIFAIMSTTLHAFCKVSEIGVARVSGNFFVKGDLDTFSPIFALHHLPNHHPP